MTSENYEAGFDGSGGAYLVVLDVDSTLIENEAIELLAARAGSLEQVKSITDRAMRGELDFANSLRERVATLAGLPDNIFDEVAHDITVTRGVPELIARVQAEGGYVCAVSGGFHELLDPLAEELGLNYWAANRLEKSGGLLTGQLVGPLIDAQAKADYFSTWQGALNIPIEKTVAVGDGANDLLMMKKAGLSVAFCAKPIVQEQADVAIDVDDLSLVLDLLNL